jgi:HK97 family phage major capsid protein
MSDDNKVDLIEVKKAVEGINKAWEEQKAALSEHDAEIKKFGAALPETEAKLAAMDKTIAALQETTDNAVLAMKRSQRIVTDANGETVDLDQKAAGWAMEAKAAVGRDLGEWTDNQMRDYTAAYKRLMRANFDKDMLSDAERKTLSVGQDTAGGYYVYPDLSGRIVAKVFETSPMRAYAQTQVISTDALEGYYDNDEVGFGWVSELESRPSTTTPVSGKWRIPVHEMYAQPEASQTILDDAIVNLETWLDGKIADKFARAENAAFVTGSGTDRPRGFLTYPDGTDLTNSIERFETGVDGAFAAAPSGGDVLINALYGLKAQYRANATWFMNRTTAALVRKLKDSDGAYLWSPGIAAGQPASLLGYPTAAFEDMPDPATDSLSIAVGDMRAAYQIVDRVGIRMLRDPFTSKPKILFYATKRTGGAMLNGEALKLVEFTA